MHIEMMLVGFVFQDANLIDTLNVYQNLSLSRFKVVDTNLINKTLSEVGLRVLRMPNTIR